MKGLGDIMKKAQQMKANMEKIQEELAVREVEASAGGGMVSVTITGAQEITALTIDQSVIDPDDAEMLQDLIQAAVNEGLRKSREMMQEEMAKITGGLPIPGLI
jgi:DNA-binding YbaB/EbfC family protein